MKKVIIFGVAIITLASFSFFKAVQPPSLKKVGKSLYQAQTTSGLKAADIEKLKAELTRQYGIKNFTVATTVHYTTSTSAAGKKGYSIADQRVTSAVFQQTMLADGDEEVKQACIYKDCPPGNTTGELVQVLSTYSVN